MNIKDNIERVPGGMMLVPLILGACVHTFAPSFADYFGSFTKGIMTGVVPILSVWFFCMGASISLKGTGTVFRKSGTLVVVKLLTAFIVAKLCMWFMPGGGITTGFFTGISALTLVSAMNMTNGGLYAGIMQRYGTEEEAGAFVLMTIESGPLMTMVILGCAGIASFQMHTFVGAILPFIVGYVVGNLDPKLRDYFSPMAKTLIPFFGFSLGNTIDLSVVAHTGMLGILLGVAIVIITGIPLMLADKYIGGGDGTAGIAASSTAGAAAATPMLIAQMSPQFATQAAQATALVATAIIVTSILTPLVTAGWARSMGRA